MSCAHGDPEDGDLMGADGKIAVPDHVAEAIRTLIAWAGTIPRAKGWSIRPSASRAHGVNIAPVMATTPPSTCRGCSKRSAAMTRSCC